MSIITELSAFKEISSLAVSSGKTGCCLFYCSKDKKIKSASTDSSYDLAVEVVFSSKTSINHLNLLMHFEIVFLLNPQISLDIYVLSEEEVILSHKMQAFSLQPLKNLQELPELVENSLSLSLNSGKNGS